MNGDGAPFDSFMFVETTNNEPLLLAFQSKWTKDKDGADQIITDDIIQSEYNKVQSAVSKYLPGTKFACVILGRSNGTFDEQELPHNCIVITKSEQLSFYGEYFYQCLNLV